jgi:hypothetical protein
MDERTDCEKGEHVAERAAPAGQSGHRFPLASEVVACIGSPTALQLLVITRWRTA